VSALGIGGLMFAVLLLLLAARFPIALAMLLVGMGGFVALAGWQPLLAHLKTAPYHRFADYTLSVVPLFVLMGQFAAKAGLSRALFDAAKDWVGHRRGGVAMAAIGACAGFGAVCGSSLATAATMARVALPEMRRQGYAPALATGALAAGGTLGILIPPSIVLVLYAVLAQASVGDLFVAALIPGLVAAAGYALAIEASVRIDPSAAPQGRRAPRAQRIAALAAVWPVLAIFFVIIGGIYGGVFTPTEAAAIGAAATALLALARRRLGRRECIDALLETAVTSGMIYFILFGAEIFNGALALSGLPAELAAFARDAPVAPLVLIIGIVVLYAVLGCVMDSLSMVLLTVPILLPVVTGLDLGLSAEEVVIWFGVLALMAVEVGLITPPVGMNVFVIAGVARDVPMAVIFRGVAPFFISDLVRIGLLIAMPGLSLWLLRLL